MKKIISITSLVLLISLFVITASADVPTTKIQSVFAKNANATAKQWYENKDTRAMLTVALGADVFFQMEGFESDDLTSFLLNTSYVGISSNSRQLLLLGYYGSTTILSIIYTPSTNEIECLKMELNGTPLDDVTMKTVLLGTMQSADNNASYEENDKTAILKQVQSLFE